MPSTFDFVNEPILPTGMMQHVDYVAPVTHQQPLVQVQPQPRPERVIPIRPIQEFDDTPEITIGGFSFSTKEEEGDKSNDKMSITVDEPTVSPEAVGLHKPQPRRKKTKNEVGEVKDSEIIRAEGTVESPSTLNSYYETAGMLKNSMDQIDMVASEIKNELDSVRASRTLKSKYHVMAALAGNLSELIEAKISAIKELNNCISKANDLDYKREKDRRDANAGSNDDKAIMDLYQAFVQNPMGLKAQNDNMGVLGPTNMASTVSGTGIVRAPADQSVNVDLGYTGYLANLTPDQTSMIYRENPDVKDCVVFDASTGAKWFQVMNVRTGQPVPNAPSKDPMFLEDVTIDIKNRIAKNTNLNQTYPLIIINENVAREY